MGKNTIVSLVITAVALGLAVVHVLKPELTIDQVTVGLGVLAVLPWLTYLFKSLKLPGGYEFVFQDIQQQVIEAKGAAQEAKGAAADAGQMAQAAFSAVVADTGGPRVGGGPRFGDGPRAGGAEVFAEHWETLARRYNEIRETQVRGAARTGAMTAVVTEMIAGAHRWGNFDVRRLLVENDPGRRLAAYAYLYALPQFELLDELVESVTGLEDKPFGQYWGIKSIRQVIGDRRQQAVSPQILSRLEQFLHKKLRVGTDRYYALTLALRDLRGD